VISGVAGPVVGRGPPGVAEARAELGDVGAEPERRFLFGSDDAPHLVDARSRGRVVAFHEVAKQGQAFDADEELTKPHVPGHRRTLPARNTPRV
jgi:hypothetical protein